MKLITKVARCIADRLFARHAAPGENRICEPLERRAYLTAPVWSNFNFNHNPPFGQPQTQSVTIDFNMDVRPESQMIRDGLQNTDLILQQVALLDTFEPHLLNNPTPGTHATFTFTDQPVLPFSGGRTDILEDANYRASISSQDVADGTISQPEEMLPGDAVHDFFVLSADANHDRVVNLLDFNALAANFGLAGRTFSQANFNYSADGLVNLQDFNILGAQFGASVPPPPTAPGIIEVGVNKDFTFDLMWADAVSGEQGWRVQYSLNADFTGAMIEDLPADSVGWTTDAFGDGTRVWFRSRAYGNGQDTAYTPERYGITPLPAPDLNTVVAISSSQIKITFTDNSQNEDNFRVLRAASLAGPYVHVGTVLPGQPTLQYIDFGLNPNTPYYYRVEAHNEVTGSAPSFGNTTTQPGTAFIDLDVFEDIDGDFMHDNSNAAEMAEGNQPTDLPYLEEDGDYLQLAFTVTGAVSSATVTFSGYSGLQLYQDVMGLYPITANQAIPLSNLGLSSGSDTVVLFVNLTAIEQAGNISVQLGNGSSGSTLAFGGNVRRRITSDPDRPDDLTLHDNNPNNDVWGGGGLDDGDGPAGDPLTDRDGFWTTHQNKTTLIIGFAGHTQSRGTHGTNGQIWRIQDVPPYVAGAWEIGDAIRRNNPGWAVTMFPEDPGNDSAAVLPRCGDGVLGRGNPYYNDARVDANNQPTGALQFLIDAIVLHGVTRVGLFGYSHGGGSLHLLMRALGFRANNNTPLFNRLRGIGAPQVRFFWSAYIDAVDIAATVQSGQIVDAFGLSGAETQYPFGVIPQGPFGIGTEFHYNAYQLIGFGPFGDGRPISGTELDPELWPHHSSRLRQEYAELPGWPRPTDHTNVRGRGIAEDDDVQAHLQTSLADAWQLVLGG